MLDSGIVTRSNDRLRFDGLERNADANSPIHYTGTTADGRRLAISFGPQHGALSHMQVDAALQHSRPLSPDAILFVAAAFDPVALDTIYGVPGNGAMAAEAGADILIPELKSGSGDESFFMIGRPRFSVERGRDKTLTVTLHGYDYYDPIKDKLESEGADGIAVWLLDTDYDGRTMRVKQMFFPQARDSLDKLAGELRRTLRDTVDADMLRQYSGTTSLPFQSGPHRTVAVKTIDVKGRESVRSEGVGTW